MILPAFSVIPKKTFLGFDKSSSHCFTIKKSLTDLFIQFFNLEKGNLQKGIKLVTEFGDFPATLRLIIQDKSKSNKIGIERKWKKRSVLNIGWKNKDDTIEMMHENLSTSISLIHRGLKNNREIVTFEHLGQNRFFISFNSIYI